MAMETRWFVTVWSSPPGEHYRDAHPDHRAKGVNCGTVESVGKVWEREFKTKAGAERASQAAMDKYSRPPISWYVELSQGGRLVIDDNELRDALR